MFENPYIVLGVPEDATSYEIKKTVDRLLSSFKDNDKILVDGKYYTEKMIKDAAIMLLNDELRPQVDLKLKHDRQNEDMIKYNLQKARFTSDDVVVSNIDNDYMNVEIVFNRDFLKLTYSIMHTLWNPAFFFFSLFFIEV